MVFRGSYNMPAAMSGIYFYTRLYALHVSQTVGNPQESSMAMYRSVWYARKASHCCGVQELVGRTKCGTIGADGRVTMPPMCRLSMDTIEPSGFYLVEDGFQASKISILLAALRI